ncbi:MAG TPA: hypothetical protein PLO23_06265 [Alphaproteobacteria bacterium]|nr:hypothetical protein [Alphaproteobacteria bacterium]
MSDNDIISQPLTAQEKRRALQNLGIAALPFAVLFGVALATDGMVERQFESALYEKGPLPNLKKPVPANPAISPENEGDQGDIPLTVMTVDPFLP